MLISQCMNMFKRKGTNLPHTLTSHTCKWQKEEDFCPCAAAAAASTLGPSKIDEFKRNLFHLFWAIMQSIFHQNSRPHRTVQNTKSNPIRRCNAAFIQNKANSDSVMEEKCFCCNCLVFISLQFQIIFSLLFPGCYQANFKALQPLFM